MERLAAATPTRRGLDDDAAVASVHQRLTEDLSHGPFPIVYVEQWITSRCVLYSIKQKKETGQREENPFTRLKTPPGESHSDSQGGRPVLHPPAMAAPQI